jgi:hypothetical protein
MTKLMPEISCLYDTEEKQWCMEKCAPEGIYMVYFEIDIHFHEWRPKTYEDPSETIFEFTPKILNVLFEGVEIAIYDKDQLLDDITDYVNENIDVFTV